MKKRQGFVLIEIVIIIFLVGVISLAVSNIIFNNNKNMFYLKATIAVDEIAYNEAYRAKIGLEPKIYEDINVKKEVYSIENAVGITGLTMEYVNVIVAHKKYKIEKTITVVRRAFNE